jgi:hypothetical protein
MALEISERYRLIHTLANLSLLTPPANSSDGNANFESKKLRLMDALLSMNLEIAQCPMWDENEINLRAARLADLAISIWPASPAVLLPLDK